MDDGGGSGISGTSDEVEAVGAGSGGRFGIVIGGVGISVLVVLDCDVSLFTDVVIVVDGFV